MGQSISEKSTTLQDSWDAISFMWRGALYEQQLLITSAHTLEICWVDGAF